MRSCDATARRYSSAKARISADSSGCSVGSRSSAQRERTVVSSESGLAAARMNAALRGGSSSSFKNAFCALRFISSA